MGEEEEKEISGDWNKINFLKSRNLSKGGKFSSMINTEVNVYDIT